MAMSPGPVTLTLDDGATRLALHPGQQLVLGRLHVSPDIPGATSVSSQQCRVFLLPTEDAEHEMMLESLGMNPTTIIRQNGSVESLQKGAMTRVLHGDRFALLSSRPDKAVSVALCSSSPSSSSGAGGGSGGNRSVPSNKHRLDARKAGPSPTKEPPERRETRRQRRQEPQAMEIEESGGGGGGGRGGKGARKAWPVVLVLVGAPGAGKSTFAKALEAESPGRWTRVCQDVIAGNGKKKGSRPQCVKATRSALRSGRSVIIDRCNFNSEQREDFIAEAADAGVSSHCVFLQLPKELCIQRAMSRTNHEGGVQGNGAKVVVSRLANMLKAPQARSEGLQSITNCKTDRDVEAARRQWTAYAQQHGPPPSGPRIPAASPQTAAKEHRPQAAAAATQRVTPVRNAFDLLMGGARGGGSGMSEDKSEHSPGEAANSGSGRRIQFGKQGWCQALRDVALDPQRHGAEHAGLRVFDRHVLLHDKFPKARHHALVVSRNPELESLEDLRREHLQELRDMALCARGWAAELAEEDPTLSPEDFRIGLHAIPSMRQLHVHIVSQDFDSTSLKNKKHWNSFTTSFFRPLDNVVKEIEEKGQLDIIDDKAAKDLLSAELQCHRCRTSCKNMPALKLHITGCLGNKVDDADEVIVVE